MEDNADNRNQQQLTQIQAERLMGLQNQYTMSKYLMNNYDPQNYMADNNDRGNEDIYLNTFHDQNNLLNF